MTNKDLVRLFFKSGYYDNNYEETLMILAEDYYNHHSQAVTNSNQQAIDILKVVQESFPDMKVSILDLIEENNKVVCRLNFTATHNHTYMGIEPSGVQVSWEAIQIFKIENGKISESWGYWPDQQIYETLQKALSEVSSTDVKR